METADDARRRGELRSAYELSARELAVHTAGSHPYRAATTPLDDAARWRAHGELCWQLARFAEARAMLERAISTQRSTLGADHPETLATLARLAAVADHAGESELAERQFAAVIAALPDGLQLAIARRNYAAFERDRGRLHEARALLDLAKPVLAKLPVDHPDHVDALKVEALLLHLGGAHLEAVTIAGRAIAAGTRCWGPDHPFVAAAHLTAARAETQLGQIPAARKRLADVEVCFARNYGAHPLLAVALVRQARAELAAFGDLLRAEQLVRRALDIQRTFHADRVVADFSFELVVVLLARDKVDDALALATDLDTRCSPRGRAAVARAVASRLRPSEALEWYEKALTAGAPVHDEIRRLRELLSDGVVWRR